MPSSPALCASQTASRPILSPASEAGHNASTKSLKLDPIQAGHWKSLSSSQRMVQFKAHYESVQTSWKGIADFLERSVAQATRESQADPKNASLKSVLMHRSKALHQLKSYMFDKAAPKMLDPLYLNQTREHLEEINRQLGNKSIDLDARLGAAIELTTGLEVCREGVALNILVCAKTLNLKTQGHPLAGIYQAARDELINQHLLTAVRATHAIPMYSQTESGPPIEYKPSKHPLHKSLEIHEVQALRNALSKDMGLQYLPDKYINPQYESTIGSIAKQQIPKLVTTHAVASLVADEVLNWVQGTGLLTGQVLSVDEKSSLHQVVDVTGSQYKDLVTSLQNELGVDPVLLFDVPDEDFNKLALVSHETLTSRLVEWIATEKEKPGSPIQKLGEAQHQPVNPADIKRAMRYFLKPGGGTGGTNPADAIYADLANMTRHLSLSSLLPDDSDNKKKKDEEQAEMRTPLFTPVSNPKIMK